MDGVADRRRGAAVSRRAAARRRARSLALVLLVSGACADDAAEEARATVTVSAAASLRDALLEAERRYEAAHPEVDVRTNLGSSGALQRQIEQGAPVDVFAAAAEAPMDALAERGLVDVRSRRRLAGNELVLIVPADGGGAVDGFEALAGDGVRRVAIGAPASVPAGAYADEVLRTLGIADAVAPKIVPGQDVRQVLAYVAAGEVDAGIVYRTDAASAGDRVRVVATAPAGSHRPIVYPVAVTRDARDPAAARAYAGFLLGPRGQAILRAHGFRVD